MAKLLLDASANVAAGTTIYQPHRFRDEKGLWQIEIPATVNAATKVIFYGRAAPDAPWHKLTEEDTGDVGLNQTNMTNVDLFPEVTVEITAYGGSGTIRGWLVD